MSGRSYVWFLEAEQGSRQYQDFYEDVQASLSKTTYRALIGFAIDLRLWPEAMQFQEILSKFDSSWHGNVKPAWDHYRELTGKTLAVYRLHGQDYFEFVVDALNTTIALPLKAIVSDRSTGFPKVAYAIEQYVQGYIGWLDAFDAFINGNPFPLKALKPQLRSENFSQAIFYKVHTLQIACEQDINSKTIQEQMRDLTFAMARSMLEEVPGRCKPPYHHPIEWSTPKSLLQRDHLLIRTYLTLRAVYPTMVVKTSISD
jgi:hypothetical protein